MWFKNLLIYRLTETFALSAEDLNKKLEPMAFRPCGSHEAFSFGFAPPMGDSSDQLVHSANGFMMICGKREERMLPASVINDSLKLSISLLDRKFSRKEVQTIKDEIIFDLLPKAFTKSSLIYAYIDTKNGYIVVDSSSAKKAEDLLSALRKCLGSLPAVPLNTVSKPSVVMTYWLENGGLPPSFNVGIECELRDQSDEQGTVKIKNIDLDSDEITNHIEHGKQVTKLAMRWFDHIDFVIDENLAVKRLKFLDLIQDQADAIEAETEAQRFDADFAIMTGELAEFIPALLGLFGGVNLD